MTTTTDQKQATDTVLARKLATILALFKGEDKTMQISLLQTFLLIKANPGCEFKTIELQMDAETHIVSRNVGKLTDEGYVKGNGKRETGLGLVKTGTSPRNASAKTAALTPAGEAVFAEFARIIRSGENGSQETR